MKARPLFYILKDRRPVACDLETWARWFQVADRQVARDEVNGIRISTVFLGLDHQYAPDGPPLLYETMVFDIDPRESGIDLMTRTSTWEQAEMQHQQMCDRVRAAIPSLPAATKKEH